jgi:hypothetical protein
MEGNITKEMQRNKLAIDIAGAGIGALLGMALSKKKSFIVIASYTVLFYQFAQIFGDIYYIRKTKEN